MKESNRKSVNRKSKIPWGLLALAVALTLWAGTKPDPKPSAPQELTFKITPVGGWQRVNVKELETEPVLIVSENEDGMRTTQELKIEKEKLDEAKRRIEQMQLSNLTMQWKMANAIRK